MTDERKPTHADPASESPPADDAGEALPAEAAAVFASWASSEPPDGFVDRVVAATRADRAAARAPGRRWRGTARWRWLLAAVAAAAIAAATSLVALRGGGPDHDV